VGPFSAPAGGSRPPQLRRLEIHGGLVDWRRYFFARPFTLAVRACSSAASDGRGLVPVVPRNTDLLRGYTAGSLINNECLSATTQTSCPELDS